MKLPTIKQYQSAIQQLTIRQREILQVIYHRPNSAATANELAEDMRYKGFQGANRQIGAIGQAIAEHTGVRLPTYQHVTGERLAYYYLVGEYNGPGWKLWPQLKKALENLDLVSTPEIEYTERLPTEVLSFEESRLYKEGKTTEVFVDRFERSRQARVDCIRHHGETCQGCGFDFGAFYGPLAQGFIQVHHLTPLASIGNAYRVDPIKDLVPLCANCHSVVHLAKPVLTLVQLKKLVKKSAKR